ncbi:cAMP-binding protein [Polaromonas sp. CF318]|nr:cAMP-binding protein [Polaromonas sp. CF318]
MAPTTAPTRRRRRQPLIALSYFSAHTLLKAGVSEPVARSVAAQLAFRGYDTQQVIWARGAEVQSWQFIISGLVAATTPTQEERSVPITIYGADSWFGEKPILNRMSARFEYVCLSETQVLVMPVAVFQKLFDTEPGFSRYLAKLTTWRAQRSAEMLTLMKLGNPPLRVVMGIAQFAEALASRSERPPTVGLDGGIAIPASQAVIAQLCGVSRAVFSEYVQPLALDGWLAIRYGSIELLSIATWQRFSSARRALPTDHINPTMAELLAELHRASGM